MRHAAIAVLLVLFVSPVAAGGIDWDEYSPMVPNGGEFSCLLARLGFEHLPERRTRAIFQMKSACEKRIHIRCAVTAAHVPMPMLRETLAPREETPVDKYMAIVRTQEVVSIDTGAPCSLSFVK